MLGLLAVFAIAGASCSLDTTGKDACITNADCLGGWTCTKHRCQRDEAGAMSDGLDAPMMSTEEAGDRWDGSGDHQGSPAGHQDGSTDHQGDLNDHIDGSPDRDGGADGSAPEPPIQGACDAGTVSECPVPTANTQCQQIYCGGRLWRDGPHSLVGYIPYRIRDPQGLFSDAYKSAIRTSATAWSNATAGLIAFAECSSCAGRFISVVPGWGDGIDNSDAWEELLPLPVDSTAPDQIPWHRIGHQWGHVVGLDDMYRRPDRDRYESFDPAVWCAKGTSLPATCAYSGPAQQPGSPPIASGTFGPYDELSVMNGLESEGVCGTGTADVSAGQPTLGDVSAVEELYFGSDGPWAPFQPIARSVGADEPLDYELAPGIDPVGGPAIAEWTAPSVDIVVRGSDGNVYETWNDLLGTTFLDWADWRVVGDHVDADPALVFAGPDTLYLAVRSAVDGSIRLRTRTIGVWGPWGSVGAPPAGAASAPAVAALGEGYLIVFVRGADNLIYQLECTDPATMCAASSAAMDAWTPLPAPSFGGFLGKPSATWLADSSALIVSAVGADHGGWLIGSGPRNWGVWEQNVGLSLSPDDPAPGVAMASNTGFWGLNFFARDTNGLMLQTVKGGGPLELGGMPISALGAVGTTRGDVRVDIAALIDDHGRAGVWWKFLSTQRTPPCNYNAPGACGAVCGCGYPGGPRCDL